MRILYLISNLNYGGAEKQTVLDANMLAQGNEVFFGYFIDGPQKEMIDKRVKLIKIRKRNYLITAFCLAGLVKKNRIQLIHSSLFASMIISALISSFCRINVIWHFHSHEYGLPLIHRLAYKILSRLPKIRAICFVNQELIQHYGDKGFNFPLHKIKLLYNSTTIQNTGLLREESNNIKIGYIGRLVSIKRVEYLLELTQYLIKNQFNDFQIFIIGDGDQRNMLETKSIDCGFHRHIIFTGFQENVEMFYSMFNLFVNPSREECLSISLIDAGISGIPSIAFNVGGNNEIIVDSQTGYIVETKEEFFEKVLFLISNKVKRKNMEEKAKLYCQEHFGKDIHKIKLQELYREVLDD